MADRRAALPARRRTNNVHHLNRNLSSATTTCPALNTVLYGQTTAGVGPHVETTLDLDQRARCGFYATFAAMKAPVWPNYYHMNRIRTTAQRQHHKCAAHLSASMCAFQNGRRLHIISLIYNIQCDFWIELTHRMIRSAKRYSTEPLAGVIRITRFWKVRCVRRVVNVARDDYDDNVMRWTLEEYI